MEFNLIDNLSNHNTVSMSVNVFPLLINMWTGGMISEYI